MPARAEIVAAGKPVHFFDADQARAIRRRG